MLMNVLIKFLETPEVPYSIIILCVTVLLWQLIDKMKTRKESDKSCEEALIRAIICACGPKGATLDKIKIDYKDQVGEKIEHHNNDYLLRKRLESIDYVRSCTRFGVTYFYSEAPAQRHLTTMIKKQNSSRVIKSTHVVDTSICNEESLGTPKTWANSLISRRCQLIENSVMDESLKVTPNNSRFNKRTPTAPKRMMHEDADQSVKPYYKDEHEDFRSSKSFADTSISRSMSRNFNDEVDPFLPKFYNFILFGDNFFLDLAVMALGFRMMTSDRILQSGYCVSGQTIAEATRNIEGMSSNQIILLNIGSVDIAQGKELIDVILDVVRLLQTCVDNQITPILTTIAPLVNYRTGNRVDVTNGLNEFFKCNPFGFPVIDLHKVFLNNKGHVDSRFFKSSTRHVSGMRHPIVSWTKFGQQTVMRTLKKELGLAYLHIIMRGL